MATKEHTTLIPVSSSLIAGVEQQTVNARELHQFLEVPTKFPMWIQRRIEEYGFLENQDFVLVSQKWETKKIGGNRRSMDYFLALDMAKELAMVERTPKGREARQYFIDCEKRLQQIQPSIVVAKQEMPALEHKPLTGSQINKINRLILERASTFPLAAYDRISGQLWGKLQSQFHVTSYKKIDRSQFEEAVQYVQSVALEGEYIAAGESHQRNMQAYAPPRQPMPMPAPPPQSAPPATITIPMEDWFSICDCLNEMAGSLGNLITQSRHNGYRDFPPQNVSVPYATAARANRAMGVIYTHTFNQMQMGVAA